MVINICVIIKYCDNHLHVKLQIFSTSCNYVDFYQNKHKTARHSSPFLHSTLDVIQISNNLFSRDGLSPELDHKSANDFKSFSSLFKST